MKRIFFLLCLFIVVVSLPIYAATRILLPEWLKSQIEAELPSESELYIGKVSSLNNLTILYEDIVYKAPQYKIEFDKFFIEPRIDLKSPLVLKVETLKLSAENNITIFRNLEIKMILENISFEEILLDGQISHIEGPHQSILSGAKFLFSGLQKGSKTLDFTAETLTSKIKNPAGHLNVSIEEFDAQIKFHEELEVKSKGKYLDFVFTSTDLDDAFREITAESFILNFDLSKKGSWGLPFQITANNISSPNGHVVDAGDITARGIWNEKSFNCDLSEILKGAALCGQIIDMVDLSISLSDRTGRINFSGNGYCVAPKSGCRQRINARIKSKSTIEIFSQIMSSGFINPLVGGVILGALMGSPSIENSEYDHSVEFDVTGNKILINGKPLI